MATVSLPYKFDLRPYQMPAWEAMNTYQFIALVWARRHGKDLTCWNFAIDYASREPMDVTYVFPTAEMGRKNLWQAKTNDGMRFKDFVPWDLRIHKTKADDGFNDTFREVTLVNGSIIRIDTGDDPDRLRGANSKLYVLSEYAEMEPGVLDVIEPVVEANGGKIIVNFTPKGDNHAKGAWHAWQNDTDWFTQMITAKDTDVFTPHQLERIQRRITQRFREQGRSEEEARSFFEQEYLCSFDTPVIGSYYGEAMRVAEEEKRITHVPYEPNIPVSTFWDLGVGDATAIWFAQYVGKEVRLIDYYKNNGQGLHHYIKVLQDKPYLYERHVAPHDIRVREFGTGQSRIDTARELGLKFDIAPKYSLEDGIDAVRRMLGLCWFDQSKCDQGIAALKQYHKQYDDDKKMYKEKPEHDWSSHACDAIRYMAVTRRETQKREANFSSAAPSDMMLGIQAPKTVVHRYDQRPSYQDDVPEYARF